MPIDGFMLRARLYGQAVGVVNDYLGPAVRERVMERFSQIAGPLQRGGRLRDPWEMIARSLRDVGVGEKVVQALHIAYLLRIDRLDLLPAFDPRDEELLEYLRQWGLLDRFRRQAMS